MDVGRINTLSEARFFGDATTSGSSVLNDWEQNVIVAEEKKDKGVYQTVLLACVLLTVVNLAFSFSLFRAMDDLSHYTLNTDAGVVGGMMHLDKRIRDLERY